MAWFRKKREDEVEETGAPVTDGVEDGTGSAGSADSADPADDPDADEAAEAVDLEAARAAEDDRRAKGPFDLAEAEDDDAKRIDLGALRLPAREGMELRLEVEDKTQRVIAATVALGGSTLQLQAFAAPRTLGVWDGIRSEIAAQVAKQGGTADEVPGVFGRELIARIPVRTADGRTGHQASRFVGVDGPRWFLRGVFGGPASHDHEAATALEDVLRSCVVVRGTEAMAPRDLLPLTLPAGAAPAPADAAAAPVATEEAADDEQETGAARSEDDLKPFDRGPEITERR